MTPDRPPSTGEARRRGSRPGLPAWDARRILAERADELGLDLDEYVARLAAGTGRRREAGRDG